MIFYLEEMLLMGHSIEEISMCHDTVIFLLQHLGFVINWKKSVSTPVQEIEFLGLKINSVNLEISLTKEKIQKVKTKCQNLLTEPETSILELTRVIGLLKSTIQAVLPARLQYRYLQLQQISYLKESHSYQQKIVLDHQSKTELLWWITNLDLCNGRSLVQCPAQVLIQTDASTKGWGSTCNGISTGGMWSAQEYHINILELLAVKLAIQTFTKYRDAKAIHLQVDNIVALTYLTKMGGTQNLKIVELAKEIWEYLLKWGITITSEYLPRELHVTADWESRNRVDAESSNFSESLPNKGFSCDRFVCISSITSDTNLRCMETRSSKSCNRCISTELVTQTPVCFSPILHDSKSSQQNTQGASPQAHINNPSLDNASLVSKGLESYFAALEKGPEKSQRGNSSPSSEQDSKTGGRARLQEEGISKTSDLISKSRRSSSNANYELSWRKWASWCSRRETDSFSSNINEILDHLTDLYKQGLQYRTINNHRSAISAFHEQIQGKPVGKHPECVLCLREFLIAGLHNQNTVSFGMFKQ